VGSRLRKARRAKRISQERVALDANLDRSFYSGVERGEHNISLIALFKVARVLEIPLATLFEGE